MSGVGTQPDWIGAGGPGEARGQETGSYWAASYFGKSSELEAEIVVRYVTSEHLHELRVFQHLEDTIYRISKMEENDVIKTTEEGAMQKGLLNIC